VVLIINAFSGYIVINFFSRTSIDVSVDSIVKAYRAVRTVTQLTSCGEAIIPSLNLRILGRGANDPVVGVPGSSCRPKRSARSFTLTTGMSLTGAFARCFTCCATVSPQSRRCISARSFRSLCGGFIMRAGAWPISPPANASPPSLPRWWRLNCLSSSDATR